eukprot:1938097-Pyramimonas_sp.AAC.1
MRLLRARGAGSPSPTRPRGRGPARLRRGRLASAAANRLPPRQTDKQRSIPKRHRGKPTRQP